MSLRITGRTDVDVNPWLRTLGTKTLGVRRRARCEHPVNEAHDVPAQQLPDAEKHGLLPISGHDVGFISLSNPALSSGVSMRATGDVSQK